MPSPPMDKAANEDPFELQMRNLARREGGRAPHRSGKGRGPMIIAPSGPSNRFHAICERPELYLVLECSKPEMLTK